MQKLKKNKKSEDRIKSRQRERNTEREKKLLSTEVVLLVAVHILSQLCTHPSLHLLSMACVALMVRT